MPHRMKRREDAPVGIDTAEELRLQIHVIEAGGRASRRSRMASGGHRAYLSTTWSQLDSISPSGTSWRVSSLYIGRKGKIRSSLIAAAGRLTLT